MQIVNEGKSWSQAVTYDPQEQHRQALAKLDRAKADGLKQLNDRLKAQEKALAALKQLDKQLAKE